MGRYTYDPSTVVASITILPKGDYEFKLGRPKAFERTARKGHQSYGVRIPLTVVGGPMDGKKTVTTLYLHSEGAQQMAKRFQMAVAGFSNNEHSEKRYDQQAAGKDWSFNPEDGSVGTAWAEYENKHLACDLDVGFQKDDAGQPALDAEGNPIQQQEWGTWRPIEGAAVGAAATAAGGI